MQVRSPPVFFRLSKLLQSSWLCRWNKKIFSFRSWTAALPSRSTLFSCSNRYVMLDLVDSKTVPFCTFLATWVSLGLTYVQDADLRLKLSSTPVMKRSRRHIFANLRASSMVYKRGQVNGLLLRCMKTYPNLCGRNVDGPKHRNGADVEELERNKIKNKTAPGGRRKGEKKKTSHMLLLLAILYAVINNDAWYNK